ncbi:MAG TPA: M20 family metallopeptidase [Thermomicrobiales bacterium]|nr:M20 family metallopeptidase [Thermomicrobiales bacterium]
MTTTTPEAAALTAWLAPRLETYLEELRQLCAIECPTASKAGVDEAGAWVRRWVTARGWELRAWPDDEVGDSLVATVRGGTPGGPRALLVAHLDTVYPVGTAAERPLRREGDRLLGPGTADNKSGLLSGLYATAALEAAGLLAPFGAVSVVCGGDEETTMRSSGALLRDLAPEADLALVLECGRETGELVGARKGGGTFVLEVRGQSAHAGVEPHKGANAILALAQQVVALHLLNGMRPGVTVNVGVIAGGSVPNAVPDYARAEIDVRIVAPEDVEPVGEAIARIAAAPYVAGTTATLGGGWGQPPMARTPAIAALADLAASCAGELGFAVSDVATGGVSYANLLAGLGLPVLDGLGPIGGLDHSPREYILVSSIVPRTALLALLLLRWAEGRGA